MPRAALTRISRRSVLRLAGSRLGGSVRVRPRPRACPMLLARPPGLRRLLPLAGRLPTTWRRSCAVWPAPTAGMVLVPVATADWPLPAINREHHRRPLGHLVGLILSSRSSCLLLSQTLHPTFTGSHCAPLGVPPSFLRPVRCSGTHSPFSTAGHSVVAPVRRLSSASSLRTNVAYVDTRWTHPSLAPPLPVAAPAPSLSQPLRPLSVPPPRLHLC